MANKSNCGFSRIQFVGYAADNAYAIDCKYRASRFANHEKKDDIIKERNGKSVLERLTGRSKTPLGVWRIKFIFPSVFF